MPLITWDKSYSVNVKRCDEQHQKLFALMNQLHDAMRVGAGGSVVQKVVRELNDYTISHFAAEELLLERFGYPGLAEHREEHQRFVAKVNQFRDDLEQGGGTSSVAVLEFLKDWLARHIKQTDRKYSSHLNENGIN
jgi:hemerythrin